MRLYQPFSPIRPGEIDKFGFNFRRDIEALRPWGCSDPLPVIVATSWACSNSALPAAGDCTEGWVPVQDADAASRILGPGSTPPQAPPWIFERFISVAWVGGCIAGAAYALEATVMLNDGRQISLSALLACMAYP